MKNIKIFVLLLVILGVYSCETYKDPVVEYSPVYPLSGQWYIQVYDATPDTLLSKSTYTMYTYNLASNTADSMWVYLSSSSSPCGAFRAKVACRVVDKVFSISSSVNNLYTNKFVKVGNGSVVLNGGKTKGGTTADAISMELITDQKPGKSFKIKGVRVSGWPEDIP